MEFALVAPAFLILLIGTFELSRYYFMVELLRTLSAETARAALIDPALTITSCAPSDSVWAKVNLKTPFLSRSVVTLCLSRPKDAANHPTILVTASYAYTTLLPLLSQLNNTMTETTRFTD